MCFKTVPRMKVGVPTVAKSSCDDEARNLTVPRSVSHEAAAGRVGLQAPPSCYTLDGWLVWRPRPRGARTRRQAATARLRRQLVYIIWELVIMIKGDAAENAGFSFQDFKNHFCV